MTKAKARKWLERVIEAKMEEVLADDEDDVWLALDHCIPPDWAKRVTAAAMAAVDAMVSASRYAESQK